LAVGLILVFFKARFTTEAPFGFAQGRQRAQREIFYEPIGRWRLAHKPSFQKSQVDKLYYLYYLMKTIEKKVNRDY